MPWRLAKSFCLFAAGGSLCLSAGCTATRLRQRTAHFGSTLPDLQYRQVLDNLIVNALRWTPAGGDVSVRAHSTATGGLEVTVADTGPGIDPSHRSRLFDPFFTTKAFSARRGTGLGLAICRRIVRAHDGQIEADNLPGGGARFVVELPLGGAAELLDL